MMKIMSLGLRMVKKKTLKSVKSGLETHAYKLAKCELKFSFASWKYGHSKKVAS